VRSAEELQIIDVAKLSPTEERANGSRMLGNSVEFASFRVVDEVPKPKNEMREKRTRITSKEDRWILPARFRDDVEAPKIANRRAYLGRDFVSEQVAGTTLCSEMENKGSPQRIQNDA